MEKILLLTVVLAFATTFFLMPKWIKRAKRAGLVGKDIHKRDFREVAESGGIIVLFGFMLGVLAYIAINTFYFDAINYNVEILALSLSVILVSFVGIIDDVLGWKVGLGRNARLLLVLFAAIPLMVINAGVSEISIPLFGIVDVGIFYPLLLIPLGIVGASTSYNFLAGYNGLEGGQGILIVGALSIAAWATGNAWLGLIGFCMVASLGGFLYYNWSPARVFPGDALTYSVGALIAGMAILGNFERFAVFIFIPYIVETFLKLRGGLKKESFGDVRYDGSIGNRYEKIYGLEHLAVRILEKIKGKAREKEVVILIYLFQIMLIIIGFLIFF